MRIPKISGMFFFPCNDRNPACFITENNLRNAGTLHLFPTPPYHKPRNVACHQERHPSLLWFGEHIRRRKVA